MRKTLRMLLLSTYSLAAIVSPAQSITWSKHMPGEGFGSSRQDGMAPLANGNILHLLGSYPSWLVQRDWQGTLIQNTLLSSGRSLTPINGGSMLTGSFGGTLQLNGEGMATTIAQSAFFIAKLAEDGSTAWVRHTIHAADQYAYVITASASPEGRVAAFLFTTGPCAWGTDTLYAPGCNYLLASFSPQGDLEWFTGIKGKNIVVGIQPHYTVLANDDAGRVWLAGLAYDTLIAGPDTVPVPNWLNHDHALLRFGADGMLQRHLVLPNQGGSQGVQYCLGLLPVGDGSVYWCGQFRNPIELNGQWLSSSTDKGLLIEFDSDLDPVRYTMPTGYGPNGFTAMAHDPTNNGLILAGNCLSSFEFGPLTLTSSQSRNCFIAFLDAQWQPLRLLGLAGYPNQDGQYAAIADLLSSEGPVHAISFIEHQATLHNGTIVGEGALLTRIDRDASVSIDSYDPAPFRIWPNPVDASLALQKENSSGTVASMAVLTIDGRIVRELQVSNAHGIEHVDCSDLAAGQYFLQVKAAEWTRTVPFIRQ